MTETSYSQQQYPNNVVRYLRCYFRINQLDAEINWDADTEESFIGGEWARINILASFKEFTTIIGEWM